MPFDSGEGSGEATRAMLSKVTRTPEMRKAFNQNEMIPPKAQGNLERDQQWSERWGAPRADVQNARRIIGEGPGWVDRLEKALADGAISLPVAAAIYAGAYRAPAAENDGS